MEEIRSSEVLEKEVLEDARKKADRISRNADKQIEELRREWKDKTRAQLDLVSAQGEAKKALRKKEADAAFPLEAQRRKLRFMDGIFREFLDDFFDKLSHEDIERVLLERGKAFAAFFAGRNPGGVEVRYAGIPREAAQRLAGSLLGRTPVLKEDKGFRGLVVSGFFAETGSAEAAPGERSVRSAYRCRLTVDEIAGEMREYHRKEIMDALIGSEAAKEHP